MNNYERLIKKLEKNGVKYKLHKLNLSSDELSVDAHVKALGIKYMEGLSTLLYKKSNGRYVAILRRDDRNIDFNKLRNLVGEAKFCNELEIKQFGFEPGLASPVILEDLDPTVEILIDNKVSEMTKVVCGATLPSASLVIDQKGLFKVLKTYKIVDITTPNPARQDGENVDYKKRILTGDTPTGKLHIGHYVGTLENRVKYQDEYETFILLANVHAYANYYKEADKINESVYQVLLDNLAVGIDPKQSTIFLESGIPEIYELYSFFMTMVTHQRLVRNPTVKDEIKYKKLNPSEGFVAYPILQAADILAFNAELVPVGEDQLPMIEQTREIARDFNAAYGDTFIEPEGKVGRIARLIGTDGDSKMSKSKGNTIFLSDSEEELKKKVMSMYTDPNRIKSTDPGTVKGNPVFVYHDAFNKNIAEVDDLKARYKKGTVGDVEVKEKLFIVLNEFLTPIRERRKYYEQHEDETLDILRTGTKKARNVVIETMTMFRDRLKINQLIEQ